MEVEAADARLDEGGIGGNKGKIMGMAGSLAHAKPRPLTPASEARFAPVGAFIPLLSPLPPTPRTPASS